MGTFSQKTSDFQQNGSLKLYNTIPDILTQNNNCRKIWFIMHVLVCLLSEIKHKQVVTFIFGWCTLFTFNLNSLNAPLLFKTPYLNHLNISACHFCRNQIYA